MSLDYYDEMGSQGPRVLEETAVFFAKEVEGAVCGAVFACLWVVCFHFHAAVIGFWRDE